MEEDTVRQLETEKDTVRQPRNEKDTVRQPTELQNGNKEVIFEENRD